MDVEFVIYKYECLHKCSQKWLFIVNFQKVLLLFYFIWQRQCMEMQQPVAPPNYV